MKKIIALLLVLALLPAGALAEESPPEEELPAAVAEDAPEAAEPGEEPPELSIAEEAAEESAGPAAGEPVAEENACPGAEETFADNAAEPVGAAAEPARETETDGEFEPEEGAVGRAQAGATPFSDGVSYSGTRTHNSRYARYETLTGIDVSTFQGSIDWKKVAADGVQFAIIRCGGRYSSDAGEFYYDQRFETNIRGALENGIEVGVYFFSQATTVAEAKQEAAKALYYMGSWADRLTLPVYLDVEYIYNANGAASGRLYKAGLTKSEQTKVALAFCDEIKKAGLDAGVYASFSSFNISAADINAAGYSVWNAHWNTKATLSAWYDVWQHTSTGTVKGISGVADLDFLYRKTALTDVVDVALDAWYAPYVRCVLEKGLFYGTSSSTFSPQTAVTREMFVTVLHRLAGSPEVNSRCSFSDAVAGAYYEEALAWAEKNGLARGLGDGSFGVGRPMTRQEMASFLYRYAAIAGRNTTARGGTDSFEDAAKTASWAAEAVAWAVGTGLINGVSDTRLDPTGTCTRAQAAAVLLRFSEK